MGFGEKIAQIRKEKNLTQEDLEKATGINKRIISRYEKNQTIPSIEAAKKICIALNISLDLLLGINNSIFIDDPEMTKLINQYKLLPPEEKQTVRKLLKAFSFYSKIEGAQQELT